MTFREFISFAIITALFLTLLTSCDNNKISEKDLEIARLEKMLDENKKDTEEKNELISSIESELFLIDTSILVYSHVPETPNYRSRAIQIMKQIDLLHARLESVSELLKYEANDNQALINLIERYEIELIKKSELIHELNSGIVNRDDTINSLKANIQLKRIEVVSLERKIEHKRNELLIQELSTYVELSSNIKSIVDILDNSYDRKNKRSVKFQVEEYDSIISWLKKEARSYELKADSLKKQR